MSEPATHPPLRVLAVCGNMVVVFGMERMAFEVLRVVRASGAEVHCILNEWENHRIQPWVESLGASWSTGFYGYSLRRTRNPLRWMGQMFHILRTSVGLLREQRRFRASHIFVPDFIAALRNAPALLWLRMRGVPVILNSQTNPDRGRFYDRLWRWVLAPLLTRVAVPSEFTLSRFDGLGIPRDRLRMIRNTLPTRSLAPDADDDVIALARSRRTLLCLGQIAPFKGTHIAVEAALALLERGEDVQLIVAGTPPQWPPEYVRYYEALRAEVASSRRTDDVHFVGNVSNVMGVMEASYLLLAPIPGEESFCLVVLEAKCSGLPVIAFRRGAVPELIEHETTGYLCHGLDRDSLIEGIDYFLADTKRRDAASSASRRAGDDPNNPSAPEAFARSWLSMFTS